MLNIGIGCQTARTDSKAQIILSPDSSKIILEGLGSGIAGDLKTAGLSQKDWQSLYPVYIGVGERPEQLVAGKYSMNPAGITFSPDLPFKRDSSYSALFFYPQYYSVTNILSSRRSIPGRVKVIEGYFKF